MSFRLALDVHLGFFLVYACSKMFQLLMNTFSFQLFLLAKAHSLVKQVFGFNPFKYGGLAFQISSKAALKFVIYEFCFFKPSRFACIDNYLLSMHGRS